MNNLHNGLFFFSHLLSTWKDAYCILMACFSFFLDAWYNNRSNFKFANDERSDGRWRVCQHNEQRSDAFRTLAGFFPCSSRSFGQPAVWSLRASVTYPLQSHGSCRWRHLGYRHDSVTTSVCCQYIVGNNVPVVIGCNAMRAIANEFGGFFRNSSLVWFCL